MQQSVAVWPAAAARAGHAGVREHDGQPAPGRVGGQPQRDHLLIRAVMSNGSLYLLQGLGGLGTTLRRWAR